MYSIYLLKIAHLQDLHLCQKDSLRRYNIL